MPYSVTMKRKVSSLICMSALFFSAQVGLSAEDEKVMAVSKANADQARDLVQQSIAAHGGKDKWYNNGLLQFRWKYHMTDRGIVVDTTQTVDPKTLNVVHKVTDKDITFGLNEGKAWISPKGAKFMPPPRFWSLTPTYFIGIPFVFNDEGANFELLKDTKEFQGKDYTQVKITYNKDSGDSPDDYYVLLIDPTTKIVRGTYYTVTSKLVAPNGPGPVKFLSLDNLKDVNGLKLASGHKTYTMKDGKILDQMRYTDVSGVKFVPASSVDLNIPSKDLIIK